MTPKTREAVERLVSNADFKVFLAHLEACRNTAVGQLVNAPVGEVQVHQGRVQTYEHIRGEINRVEESRAKGS